MNNIKPATSLSNAFATAFALAAALTLLLLSGCYSSTYMASAATDGNGVTCNEIYQAFSAYDRDRQSAQALQQLSILISQDAGAIAGQGISHAEQYYSKAKTGANLALAIRGCQPI